MASPAPQLNFRRSIATSRRTAPSCGHHAALGNFPACLPDRLLHPARPVPPHHVDAPRPRTAPPSPPLPPDLEPLFTSLATPTTTLRRSAKSPRITCPSRASGPQAFLYALLFRVLSFVSSLTCSILRALAADATSIASPPIKTASPSIATDPFSTSATPTG